MPGSWKKTAAAIAGAAISFSHRIHFTGRYDLVVRFLHLLKGNEMPARARSLTSLLTAALALAVVTNTTLPSASAAPGDDKAGDGKLATAWAHIVISGAYPEGASMPGIFGAVSETLAQGLDRVNKAAADKEVAGVVLRIKSPALGWAKLNEFRTSIERVRKAGKKVIAVVDEPATQSYLLACACDEIIMPEGGAVMVLGLRMEVMFYKKLFENVGIHADMMQVGEYKGAAEPYTRTDMSPAFREEMEAMLDDYYEQIISTIAKSRKLDPKKVEAAIDSGPHTATAAKELGLIDRIAYEDEVNTILAKEYGGKTVKKAYGKEKLDTDFSGLAGMMKMMNMMMGVPTARRVTAGDKIAVIHATGVIMTGRSMNDPFGGEVLGADTLVKAIKKAEESDQVKAIVLRIDSPGGSALASDLMWRALKNCKKPVVASMGNTAASGGYYIAMGCDEVYAEPGTLTGSIGVVGGKLATGGVFNKIGLTTSVIQRGKNAGALSSSSPFTDSEKAAMKKLMTEIYVQFTTKCAEQRGMKLEDLEKLARGRVYTGNMAKKLNLVDELGTLDDAVAKAQKLAGLDPSKKLERIILPKPASPFEALFGPLAAAETPGSGHQAAGFISALKAFSPELARELSALSVLRLLSQQKRMTVVPFRIRVE